MYLCFPGKTMSTNSLWPVLVILICLIVFIVVLGLFCKRWWNFFKEQRAERNTVTVVGGQQLHSTREQNHSNRGNNHSNGDTSTSSNASPNRNGIVFRVSSEESCVVDLKPPPYCELPPSYGELFGETTPQDINTNIQTEGGVLPQ